jgi:hypothetical protein
VQAQQWIEQAAAAVAAKFTLTCGTIRSEN